MTKSPTGDFQATVISDGYGIFFIFYSLFFMFIPVRPILVMNASEAELAPVLKANFMTSSWRVQACRQGVPALATAKCRLVTPWHRDEGSASQASLTRPGKGRYARRASWSDEWRATFRTFTSDEFGTTAHLSNFEFPACWHRKLNGSTVRWGRFDTPALERLGA
jgi:hypothetical protein